MKWYADLCEYYGVSPEEALELGTRSSGRKPSLPASNTTHAVHDMTFEDIWASSPRQTVEDIFKFYKDQGAWSAFRQCVRHKDLENLHLSILQNNIQQGGIFEGAHICEYGSGVAPFMTTLLGNLNPAGAPSLLITLADVDCEHFTFAQYRLPKIIERRGLKNIELNFETIKPDSLPTFADTALNAVLCFEVLEHVPSPVEVLKNMQSHMAPSAIYVEKFVKHEGGEKQDGPDLLSARNERALYYELLGNNFALLSPSLRESNENPNCTRFWKLK